MSRRECSGAGSPHTLWEMADPQDPTLPAELPVLPVRSTVVFPLSVHPLVVTAPAAINSVNRALAGDRLIALLFQHDGHEDVQPDALSRIGTAGIVRQMARGPNGIQVLVEGLARIRADRIDADGQTVTAAITPLPERVEPSLEVDAHVRRIRELVDRAFSLASGLPPELRTILAGIDDPLRLCYLLASLIDMSAEGQAAPARAGRPRRQAERHRVGRHARGRAARDQGQDRVAGAAGDDRRAAAGTTCASSSRPSRRSSARREGQELEDVRTRIAEARLPEAVAERP